MKTALVQLLGNDTLINQIKEAIERSGYYSVAYYNPQNGAVSTHHIDAHFRNDVISFGCVKPNVEEIKKDIQQKIEFYENMNS